MRCRQALMVATAALLIVSALPSSALEIPTVIRGSGTVMMLPDPGPLTMTFSKRDLNIYDGSDAMPISVHGPLGEEVASVTLPDDGDAGKGRHGEQLQQETVTVNVE